MPAWKADKLIESNKIDQVDLTALGEATGILFDSREMLSEAVQFLEKIRKEKMEQKMISLGCTNPLTRAQHKMMSKK